MKNISSSQRRITLIGAPTDIGAGVRGASMGPEALRVAGIRQRLEEMDVEVSDVGDLHGPRNPDQAAVEGYRHLDEVVVWNGLVRDAVARELRAQRMPVLLGGDHCLAIGSIDAIARHCRERGKKLRILWLDAHADFNTAALTPTGNMHGMPLACLCGLGPDTLTRVGGTYDGAAACESAIRPDAIRQIGVRSVDDGERRLLKEQGVEVFDMRSIDELGMYRVMQRALAGIDDDTHLHVSFDVDFLDPSIAPGVGTTVGGGPTYREARLCMEMIADTGRMASLDIVELNPALDVRNRTAEVAVDLVGVLFGRSLMSPTQAEPVHDVLQRVLTSLVPAE